MAAAYIEFDGIASSQYGLYIATPPSHRMPDKIIDEYTIPGRSGSVISDFGLYNNVERSYEVSFGKDFDTKYYYNNINAITRWLAKPRGYAKLTDTYMGSAYQYNALFKGGAEFTNILGMGGTGTITFECEPYKYRTNGMTLANRALGSLSGGYKRHTITNPTGLPARPIIKVTTNNTKFEVNIAENTENEVDMVFALPSGITTVYIDSNTGEVYHITSGGAWRNMSNRVTMISSIGFPILGEGGTTIRVTSPVTKVEVAPRWWEI